MENRLVKALKFKLNGITPYMIASYIMQLWDNYVNTS